jgi:hypothetical protein
MESMLPLAPLLCAASLWAQEPAYSLKGLGLDLDAPAAQRLRLDSVFLASGTPTSSFSWGCADRPAAPTAGKGSFGYNLAQIKVDVPCGMDQAGVLSRGPLLAESPFLNLHQSFEIDGPAEGSFKLQAGVVDLRARLFSDDAPQLDPQVDAAVRDAASMAAAMGLIKDGPAAASYFSYSSDIQSSLILVASALGQAGKSWRLAGPWDLGVVAGGLARFAGEFPNATLDQELVLRARVGDGFSIGLFGGVTEALGFVDPARFWSESLAQEKAAVDVRLQAAPHLSAEAWGRLPWPAGGRFTLGGGEQVNPNTFVTDAHASATIPIRRGTLTVAGRFENETGGPAEFNRTKGAAEIAYSPASWIGMYTGLGIDDAALGDARMQNQSFMTGVRGSVPEPGGPGVSLDFMTGADKLQVDPSAKLVIFDTAIGLAKVLGAFQSFRETPNEATWKGLRSAYGHLDPALKKDVDDVVQSQSPGLPSVSDILSIDPLPQSLASNVLGQLQGDLRDFQSQTGINLAALSPAQFAELASLLGNQEIYERALVRLARHVIQEQLASKPVDLLGASVTMNAPLILALANVYGLGLEPPPAMTAQEARYGLDPFIFNKLQSISPSCSGSSSEEDFVNCALGLIPNGKGEALKRSLGPQLSAWLRQAISWHSDLIRTQINQTLLQVFMTAESLNAMTVDQGVRIGELDKQWLIGSLDRLDAREQEDLRSIVRKAEEEVEADQKARVAALRRFLTEYGHDWLRSLRETPGASVSVPDSDWAPLLASYRDQAPAFIEKLRNTLPDDETLRVEFNPVPEFGIVTQKKGGVVTVKLPPNSGSADADQKLETALSSLARPVH